MVGGQQDLRQAFVIAQQDVVARFHLLDQVRLKKQRFGFRLGDDDFQLFSLADHAHQPVRQSVRLGIAGHPPRQIARLANIQHLAIAVGHAVNAGISAKLAHLCLQIGGAAGQIGWQIQAG